jgi:hypothetical protein
MSATVTRVDGPNGRFYNVDGELLPSVTHILGGGYPKPALVYWSANVERAACTEAAAALYEDLGATGQKFPASWYLTELQKRLGQVKAHQKALVKAGDIGTEAHRMIEYQLRTAVGAKAGEKPVISDAAQWSVFAFEDWAKSVRLKPVLCERVVWSKVYGFAGTLDLLARVNGVMTEVSIKTGKGVYAEAHLQSAAYVTALSELGYLPPAGGSLIVRLPKDCNDPAFEVVQAQPAAELLPVFLAVKQVWAFQYAQDAAYRARRRKAVA